MSASMNGHDSPGIKPERYGAYPDAWRHFAALGLTADLLPVVANPNAEISPRSDIDDIGKTPSRYNRRRKVAGIPRWTQLKPKPEAVTKWSREPDYGICLQTRLVRGIDVDTKDPLLSKALRLLIAKHLGVLPIRSRSNSAKFLAALTLPGKYAKRAIRIDDENVVEFLANGQQFIAESTHESGVRYVWEGGLPSAFPDVSAETFEAFWSELQVQFSSDRKSQSKREAVSEIDQTQTPPLGRTIDQMRETLSHIDVTLMDYDEWFSVHAAAHHESGGSDAAFDLVDEWSARPGAKKSKYRSTEYGRAKYDSCNSDKLGCKTWRTVEWLARLTIAASEWTAIPVADEPGAPHGASTEEELSTAPPSDNKTAKAKDKPLPYSDLGNSLRLARAYSDRIRFTQNGFMVHKKSRWVQDQCKVEIQRLAMKTAKLIYSEIPDAQEPGDALKHARRSSSRSAIEQHDAPGSRRGRYLG